MSRRSTLRAGFNLLPLSVVTPQGPTSESQLVTGPTPSREPSWEDLLGRR